MRGRLRSRGAGATQQKKPEGAAGLVARPQASFRWNFTVMGMDYSLFILGLSFASVYGVMPLFVRHLTDSNLALGLISGLRAAAFLLPQILVAGVTERLHRKMPFLLVMTTFERLPYLALAVATPLLAVDHPVALLWLFFVLIAVSNLFGGIGLPAWVDVIARMMPSDWRGRFFGLAAAVGGLLSVAGGAGAAEILQRFRWPANFALCFACTFICLVASFCFIALGREPAPAPRTAATTHAGHPWGRLPEILRSDRNFATYIVGSGLITIAGMAASFYAVDAKAVLHLTDAGAGIFAVALLASSTVGNLLWGYVGDHRGHKRVVEAGALCTGLAAAVALAGPHPVLGGVAFGAAFVLVGLGSSAIQLAGLTFIIDFAPSEQRPTYVGLANALGAPFAFGAPLAGGLLADHAGYGAVFLLSIVVALGGGLVVLLSVRDPRRGDLHPA